MKLINNQMQTYIFNFVLFCNPSWFICKGNDWFFEAVVSFHGRGRPYSALRLISGPALLIRCIKPMLGRMKASSSSIKL